MSEGESDKHTTVWVCSLTIFQLFRNTSFQFCWHFITDRVP